MLSWERAVCICSKMYEGKYEYGYRMNMDIDIVGISG